MFAPENGKQGRGRPRLRFYDTVKLDIKARNIELNFCTQKQSWDILQDKAADQLNLAQRYRTRREARIGLSPLI